MTISNPKDQTGEHFMEPENLTEESKKKEEWQTPVLELRGDLLAITASSGGSGPGDSFFQASQSGG